MSGKLDSFQFSNQILSTEGNDDLYGHLSADDLNDFLNDPRARKYARDLPDWMIDALFEGVMEKHKINEQQALFPVRVDMQVDFTDDKTTEESFVEDIEKAIQGVIDKSGANVSWTVNDYTIGEKTNEDK